MARLAAEHRVDDLDKERERRSHDFGRYADDCNVYVATRRSGERVMQTLTGFREHRLKLTVNAEKRAVARPWERKFLGFTLRAILWRQWKRTWTRMQNLRKRGLDVDRAAASAFNGRGPWWNAGASHINEAYPKRYFDQLGLVSLLGEVTRQRQVAT